MGGRTKHVWAVVVWLMCAAPVLGQTAAINWPDAVSRLAEERTKAEVCVTSLKKYGNEGQKAQGRLAYGVAKTNFDGVIAGLITASAKAEILRAYSVSILGLHRAQRVLNNSANRSAISSRTLPGKRVSLTPWSRPPSNQ